MSKNLLRLTLLVSLLLVTSYSIALLLETPVEQEELHFKQPAVIIKMFYQAVDRGELHVFDQVLGRDMITPVHINYRYELSSDYPTTTVYSLLKKEIPIPAHPNCVATGISAILSLDGRIIKTEVHVTRCD